ncbi:MAG: ATP-binding protein, partial [Verrucomicrobiota bacterium]
CFAGCIESELWIGTDRGILRFDRNTEEFAFLAWTSHLGVTEIAVCPEHGQELLALSSNGDLFSINPSTESLVHLASKQPRRDGTPWETMMVDATGNIWLGGDGSLAKFDRNSNEWDSYEIFAGEYTVLQINKIVPGLDPGMLWLATSHHDGLLQFNSETGTLFNTARSFKVLGRRGQLSVEDLAFDRLGGLWMASDEAGLVRVGAGGLTHEMIGGNARDGELIHGGTPRRTLQLSEEEYLHLADEGLVRVDFASRSTDKLHPDILGIDGPILDIAEIDGLLYFTNSIGLFRLVLDSDEGIEVASIAKLDRLNDQQLSLLGQSSDEEGFIWLTRGSQLFRVAPETGIATPQCHTGSWIVALEVAAGVVLAATRDDLYIRQASGGFHRVAMERNALVSEVAIDSYHQRIWGASERGLFSADLDGKNLKFFSDVSVPIDSIAPASDGNIWITNRGRMRLIDVANERFIRFPKQAEFEQIRGGYHRVSLDGAGNLLLAGWSRLIRLAEADLFEVPEGRAELFLAGIRPVAASDSESSRPIEGIQQGGTRLDLASDVIGLELDFVTSDYRLTDASFIEYRVNAGPWREAVDGTVSLGGIRSGSHSVEVKGLDSGGRALLKPFSLDLLVRPPLWQRPWFLVASFVTLFALGLLIQGYRIRSIARHAAALSASDARYRRVFRGSSDAILLVSVDGVILDLNPAAGQLLGIDGSTQHSIRDFAVSPDKLGQLIDEARSGSVIRDRPLRLKSATGEELVTKTTISAGAGEPEIRVHFRDLTREAHLEAQVSHAQKMEAVGTLAGGIAHDFNNLLTPIIIRSDLALADLKQERDGAVANTVECLEVCSEAAWKAAGLVTELLKFAKRPEQDDSIFDLAEATGTCIKLLRGSITSNVSVKLEEPGQKMPVRCSAQQFELALTNLGVNASHAIGTNAGVITVSLREGIPSPDCLDNSPHYKLTVHDTGCGMGEETLKRIFEPFYTTKDLGKGTGLGLAMVHRFIEDAGAEIHVESSLKVGTTFTINIPKAVEASRRTKAAKSPSATAAKLDAPRLGMDSSVAPAKRILVIDDEPLVLKATGLILERNGHHVVTKECAKDALKALESASPPFDLIVSDQMMPGMTGLEFARELRKRGSGIPLILLTGYSDVVLDADDVKDLVEAVHMKPVDYHALQDSINQTGKRSDEAPDSPQERNGVLLSA